MISIDAAGVTISGKNPEFGGPQTVTWLAAAPAAHTDSYMGSGLPFPNRTIAFDNTPNRGSLLSTDGTFLIRLPTLPNSFYAGVGTTYIPPHVRIDFEGVEGRHHRVYVETTPGIPKRFLTDPPLSQLPRAAFQMPICTAAERLMSQAQPTPDNWRVSAVPQL